MWATLWHGMNEITIIFLFKGLQNCSGTTRDFFYTDAGIFTNTFALMNVVVDYWVSLFSKKKVFRKSVRVQTVSLWKKFKLVCIELDWRRILLSLPASYIVVRSTCTTSQIQQNKILFTWMWPALSHPILQSIQFTWRMITLSSKRHRTATQRLFLVFWPQGGKGQ